MTSFWMQQNIIQRFCSYRSPLPFLHSSKTDDVQIKPHELVSYWSSLVCLSAAIVIARDGKAMCASAAMAAVASQVFLVCSASGDARVH